MNNLFKENIYKKLLHGSGYRRNKNKSIKDKGSQLILHSINKWNTALILGKSGKDKNKKVDLSNENIVTADDPKV